MRILAIALDVVLRLTRKVNRQAATSLAAESSRYCYSVWLRHLSLVDEVPRDVLELGPGASVGVGYAALLSGAQTYLALDEVAHVGHPSDPDLLAAIAALLETRAPIPGPSEFPQVRPTLPNYAFPRHILTDEKLASSLDINRRTAIDGAITYRAPWAATATAPRSIDMIISQAVMEHVDDPESAYRTMAGWLRPGGIGSHQIDFHSHGVSRVWNGHWRYPPGLWHRLRGKADPINRWPLSAHLRAIERAGLKVRLVERIVDETGLRRTELDRRFRELTEDDLVTAGAFIQFVKGPA